MRELFSLVEVPVVLACGAADAMVSAADLGGLGTEAVVISDVGHNVHIEAPGAVAGLALGLLETLSSR